MGTAELLAGLSSELHARGVDVACPLNLRWYNEEVKSIGAGIPAQGSAGEDALTILIGNTKSTWDHFLDACAGSHALRESEHPFDDYVQKSVLTALNTACAGRAWRVYWSHVPVDDLIGCAKHVAMQRMAASAGLAFLDPDCHLSLHPKYGPWFALRAAVVFDDVDASALPRPPPLRSPLCATTQHYVKLAVRTAMNASAAAAYKRTVSADRLGLASAACAATSASTPESVSPRALSSPASMMSPAGSVESTELPEAPSTTDTAGAPAENVGAAIAGTAVAETAPRAAFQPIVPTFVELRRDWEKWVAVRDAPLPGHPWRYCRAQLRYHYGSVETRKSVLRHALHRHELAPATPERSTLLLSPLSSAEAGEEPIIGMSGKYVRTTVCA